MGLRKNCVVLVVLLSAGLFWGYGGNVCAADAQVSSVWFEPDGALASEDCANGDVSAGSQCLRPVKSSRYDTSDALMSFTKYRYNKAGQLTRTNTYEADSPTVIQSYVTYKYDAQGKLVKASIYEGSTLNYYGTLKYNSKGQVIRINAYDAKSKLLNYGICKYDSKGLLTKASIYDAAGKLLYVGKITYDSSGRRTKVSLYDPSNKLLGFISYAYNTDGTIKKETVTAVLYGFNYDLYYSTYAYKQGTCPPGSKDALFLVDLLNTLLQLEDIM